MKNKIMIPLAALTITAAGLALTTQIKAQEQQANNQHETLITKLVSKFNLNKDEVTQVFDEAREEHQAQRQAEMKTRLTEKLTQAVTEGTITEEQKTLIIAKQAEMQQKHQAMRDELKNITQEERQTKMQELRNEWKTWAESNGIDLSKLDLGPDGSGCGGQPGGHGGSGKGPGPGGTSPAGE